MIESKSGFQMMGSGQSMETVVNGDWEHQLCWMDKSPQHITSLAAGETKMPSAVGGRDKSRRSTTSATSDKPKILVTMSSEDKQVTAPESKLI